MHSRNGQIKRIKIWINYPPPSPPPAFFALFARPGHERLGGKTNAVVEETVNGYFSGLKRTYFSNGKKGLE